MDFENIDTDSVADGNKIGNISTAITAIEIHKIYKADENGFSFTFLENIVTVVNPHFLLNVKTILKRMPALVTKC